MNHRSGPPFWSCEHAELSVTGLTLLNSLSDGVSISFRSLPVLESNGATVYDVAGVGLQ
jgi:hypothetical protein